MDIILLRNAESIRGKSGVVIDSREEARFKVVEYSPLEASRKADAVVLANSESEDDE